MLWPAGSGGAPQSIRRAVTAARDLFGRTSYCRAFDYAVGHVSGGLAFLGELRNSVVEDGLDVPGRTWLGEQESLGSGAPQGHQGRCRDFRFHSLGNDLQTEGIGQTDDRTNNSEVMGARAQVANKSSVNLEDVDRQGFELREGTVAGPEGVNGHGDTDRPEATDGGQRLVRVPDQGLFGDLHSQVLWLEVAGAQDLSDRGHEVHGDQLRRRDVDTQSEPRVLLVPLGELPASSFDHPAAQFAVQVGGLDDVDEGMGLQ